MTNFRLYSYLLSSTVPVTNANMTTILVCQHPILHSVLTQKVDHPPTGYYVLLRCRKLFTRGMSLPTLLDDHAEHDTGGKAEDNRQTLTDNLNIDDPLETSWEDIFTVLQVCFHDTANFIENLLQATTSLQLFKCLAQQPNHCILCCIAAYGPVTSLAAPAQPTKRVRVQEHKTQSKSLHHYSFSSALPNNPILALCVVLPRMVQSPHSPRLHSLLTVPCSRTRKAHCKCIQPCRCLSILPTVIAKSIINHKAPQPHRLPIQSFFLDTEQRGPPGFHPSSTKASLSSPVADQVPCPTTQSYSLVVVLPRMVQSPHSPRLHSLLTVPCSRTRKAHCKCIQPCRCLSILPTVIAKSIINHKAPQPHRLPIQSFFLDTEQRGPPGFHPSSTIARKAALSLIKCLAQQPNPMQWLLYRRTCTASAPCQYSRTQLNYTNIENFAKEPKTATPGSASVPPLRVVERPQLAVNVPVLRVEKPAPVQAVPVFPRIEDNATSDNSSGECCRVRSINKTKIHDQVLNTTPSVTNLPICLTMTSPITYCHGTAINPINGPYADYTNKIIQRASLSQLPWLVRVC